MTVPTLTVKSYLQALQWYRGVAAYAGYLLLGVVALGSMLIMGFPLGIIAHYWMYGRAG